MADTLVPNYFFMNDKIYKKLSVVKSEDFITVWSYADERRMRFGYVSTRRNAVKAYDVTEVAKLLERPVSEVLSFIGRGLAPRPSGQTYNISNKKPGPEFWSEDDILYLRDRIYEMTPKKKDGEPFAKFNLVSKAELMAKFTGDDSYYVKDSTGNLVKVWKAI